MDLGTSCLHSSLRPATPCSWGAGGNCDTHRKPRSGNGKSEKAQERKSHHTRPQVLIWPHQAHHWMPGCGRGRPHLRAAAEAECACVPAAQSVAAGPARPQTVAPLCSPRLQQLSWACGAVHADSAPLLAAAPAPWDEPGRPRPVPCAGGPGCVLGLGWVVWATAPPERRATTRACLPPGPAPPAAVPALFKALGSCQGCIPQIAPRSSSLWAALGRQLGGLATGGRLFFIAAPCSAPS